MTRVRNSAQATRKRIVVGGPRRALLEGLKEVASNTCHVLAVSSNFTVIQQAVRLLAPDCAIIDCGTGCWELESVMDRLGSVCPGLRILAFLPDDEMTRIEDAGGADRESLTLLPASASEELFHEKLAQIIGAEPDMLSAAPQPPAGALRFASQSVLTPRQRDILSLICSAQSTKGIARILDISTRTVEFHKYRMMKTLAVNTMAELILFGLASGMGSQARRPLALEEASSGATRPPRHEAHSKPAPRRAEL
jgi:DNA-binding NarL/FixJ family response regulator